MRFPLLLTLLLLPGCTAGADAATRTQAAMSNLLVIGHRGASGYAPEHTFASWDLAARLGVDYLEQDLQMTRDGVLVVMHDETLDRTARRNGERCTGRVIDHTWAELRDCEVGSWFNEKYRQKARPEYSDQPLPTLEQVLERYRDSGTFYIETKKPEEAPGMEAALVAMLRRFGLTEPAANEWRVLVQSFSEASLRKLQQMDGALPLIQLIEKEESARGIEARLDTIAQYAVGIGPHFSDVDAQLVEAAHARCLAVHPYTVNEPADQAAMVAAGVDGMFTDYADRLLSTRPADEPRGRAATAAAAAAWHACRQRKR